MKIFVFGLAILFYCNTVSAQTKKITDPLTPCNETADAVTGIYTDHTNPKYGSHSIKGGVNQKAAMIKQLIAIEKLEEGSRKDFKLTGCAARVSFSGGDYNNFGKIAYAGYGYQLGIYQFVCHVTQGVTKIVGEYQTVLRVYVNPYIPTDAKAGGTGEFAINGNIRYVIPIDARDGPDYINEAKNNPSKVSQYISESMVLANRSNDYKSRHTEFLKVINGEGYTENWIRGDRYKPAANNYHFIDRRYLITKPGIPLLLVVSRKQYLEDMLEYLEIEKANFYLAHAARLKNIVNSTADWAKKEMAVLEKDKNDYPGIYEAKKAKIKELLASQQPAWLQKPAVVDNNNKTYDANKRLENLGKFYDVEDEYTSALYILNPAYFTAPNGQPAKPLFMEVQMRYEIAKDKGFSERYFSNFLKNFDMAALRKML